MRDERGDRDCEHERGVGEDGDHQVAARAHQREAVPDIPGRSCDGEATEREHPEQRERVTSNTERRRAGSRRDEQHRQHEARGGDRRREPVHDPGAFDVDRALAPEPPQFPVRLQRRRPAASLQPRLPVLDQPRKERRQQDPADELDDDRHEAHPISPTLAATSSTSTSAIR